MTCCVFHERKSMGEEPQEDKNFCKGYNLKPMLQFLSTKILFWNFRNNLKYMSILVGGDIIENEPNCFSNTRVQLRRDTKNLNPISKQS